jgi:hypothetical protein
MRAKHQGVAALLANLPTAKTDKSAAKFGTWGEIVALFRRKHPVKTAELVAAWTEHPLRTVYRWMRGETVPDADVAFDLIRTDHGPAIIELIARSLPPKERAQFFRDLMRVAERAELQARLEGLGEQP